MEWNSESLFCKENGLIVSAVAGGVTAILYAGEKIWNFFTEDETAAKVDNLDKKFDELFENLKSSGVIKQKVEEKANADATQDQQSAPQQTTTAPAQK